MDMADLNFKIKPTDDYIFKRLFGDKNNKDILIAFLNSLFEEYDYLPKIEDLEFKNTEIPKVYEENKGARLDIKAKINENTYIDIEVQSKDPSNLVNRSIFYNAFTLINEIEEGSFLREIPQVISIWIIKGELNSRSIFKDYESPIVMSSLKTDKSKLSDKIFSISNDFNIIYIFLDKLKDGILNENLENWLKFIDNRNVTDVKDDKIIKAISKMNLFRGDEVMKAIYEAELKARFDKIEYINEGLNEGIKKGKEEGLKEGKKEGIEEGREEGLKEGEKKGKIEMAKNMLKDNVDINIISKYSGLSIEEITLLKK